MYGKFSTACGSALIERVTDFNMEMIKQIIDAGADLIISEGDYAEKRWPLVPSSSSKTR